MNKLSKVLVMAVLMLALVLVSFSVNAYSNSDLISYVNDGSYTLGGKTYSLSDKDKVALTNYLTENPVSDEDANAIRANVEAIIAEVEATGVKSIEEIDANVMAEITKLAQAAGARAGLDISIDSAKGTVTIATEDGAVLVSTTYVGEETSDKLLYTGTNSLVFVLPVLAIVAVAIIVKKRAH